MQMTVIGLPAREAQALSLVAQGMTTKRAAKDMNCSPRNVEALIEHSMRRLHANLFIEFYNLQPVIVWDDGLYLTYQ
jgi:DNA-binding CsgD family transcriptional regulator